MVHFTRGHSTCEDASQLHVEMKRTQGHKNEEKKRRKLNSFLCIMHHTYGRSEFEQFRRDQGAAAFLAKTTQFPTAKLGGTPKRA